MPACFRAAGETDLAAALTRSVRPAFAVYNPAEELLVRGTAGDEPISLMPGKYTVRVGEAAFDVRVEEGELTRLALD